MTTVPSSVAMMLVITTIMALMPLIAVIAMEVSSIATTVMVAPIFRLLLR
jgi:hypothetical protein